MGKKSANATLILVCLHLFACFLQGRGDGRDDKIKGMFVFGSSLVDNGNNNFLENSLAKADFLPYGIDFPHGPSGRFTNGKNVIDLLGEMLKLPCLIPPFTDPSTQGSKIVHGVNFASGASGILDDTGFVARQVITLSQQIRNFEEVTLPQLEKELGIESEGSSTEEEMKKYLFVVGTGGNDYSFNYFLRNRDNNVTRLQAFTANLTNSLSLQLKRLYALGARKFVLMAVNPLGCYPMVNALGQGKCVEVMNQAATLFNDGVKSLIDASQSDMPNSSLVFVDSYKIMEDIIKNPSSKGFENVSSPCCEVVPQPQLGGSGTLCRQGGTTCNDRRRYVFFDGIHSTEAVNVEIARKAFISYRQTEVYPINVYQLAKLKIH